MEKRKSADDSRLSSEDMVKVLDLLKGSTSLELKVMVPDRKLASIRGLGFDPVEAETRQTYFFDTPDLALDKAGLIVRARRGPHGKGDTVVKLRPIHPIQIEEDLRRDEAFKIEVDVMPGGFVCSASARGRCTAEEVYDVTQGRIALDSIFTRNQRDFYAAHAPAGISMSDLVPLGPIFVLRIKHQPPDFDRKMVVELWLYHDGSRVVELSTKGSPEEAFQFAAQFRMYLVSHGIPLERGAATKTGSALAYFSKHSGFHAAS